MALGRSRVKNHFANIGIVLNCLYGIYGRVYTHGLSPGYTCGVRSPSSENCTLQIFGPLDFKQKVCANISGANNAYFNFAILFHKIKLIDISLIPAVSFLYCIF